MATTATADPLRISQASQKHILDFVSRVLSAHIANSADLSAKMDAIDVAYARYQESAQENTGGVDVRAGNTACDVFDTQDRITPPLVVSQVDSFTGYLADVFLSGYPMFPVLGTPASRKYAEQLETLLDDHALLGAYPRELLMFIRDACKYNYAAIEVDWAMINQFSTLADLTTNDPKLQKKDKYYNRIKRLDPRNVIRDPSVLPGDLAEHGDYAGYIDHISLMQLKRFTSQLQKEKRALNLADVVNSAQTVQPMQHPAGSNIYKDQPVISNYISQRAAQTVDWDAWLDQGTTKKVRHRYGAVYERVILYARIIPADYQIAGAPQPNTPQIWKIITINGKLLTAYRIISAYDYLPILFGQPIEDGFAEQTQSIAESQIPFQEAAGTLYNIRFAAARRAVSDRALYNSNVLSPKDVNSKAAAPKIPVNLNPLSNVTFDSIYKQIPFDMRGTETTLQDASTIAGFGQQLSGLNNARQGQFQRGNKSVTEWQDVQSGSENRLRLPALTLEYQVFAKLKSIMVLNIFQFGEDMELVSQKSEEVVKINIAELRKQVLSFRVADGYTPKSKMASTDMLANGLTTIGNSQVLQQAYGASLPAMFAHLMSLGGVRGLEEYNPQAPAQSAPVAANLQEAALQQVPINPAASTLP